MQHLPATRQGVHLCVFSLKSLKPSRGTACIPVVLHGGQHAVGDLRVLKVPTGTGGVFEQ